MPITDIIQHWNLLALETIREDYSTMSPTEDPSPEQAGPTTTSRAMAMVHIALYDAFEQAEKRPTYYAYPDCPKLGHAAQQVAVSVAAHDVLTALYRRQSTRLGREKDRAIAQIGAAAEQGDGEALGARVAKEVLKRRENDGADNPHDITYAPSGPFDHDKDPENCDQGFLSPHWGSVTPFGVDMLIAKIATTRWDMTRYRRDHIELTRGRPTAEQVETGLFWAYDGARNIGVPMRLYNQVVHAILAAHGPITEAKSARLFAVVNVAMADAGIQCWEQKYRERLWRPILGIQRDAHNPDPAWKPQGAPRSNQPDQPSFTPAFPAYPSGHASFGAAALRAAARVLGLRPDFTFEFTSDELNGITQGDRNSPRPNHPKPRTLTIEQALQENLESRVFLEVHWRMDGEEGTRNGLAIADLIAAAFPTRA